MTVNLSLLAGAGWQFSDDNGVPLSGGLLYTYAAGTTTPAATYTSTSGATANSNPIVLNAGGRVPYEIWLTSGSTYKFVLKTSTSVEIGTYDNISGANDFAAALALLYADFANTNNVAKGDALVGFKQSNSSGALTGAVGSTVHNKLQESISVKDFGATGNNSTNDAAAFTAANVAPSILIPAGNYVLNTNVTFTAPVFMMPGAILKIATGITVAFNNGFAAGVYQVFNCAGTGKVTFASAYFTTGYPEWWGAVAGGTDCLAAFRACILACTVTQLQATDYLISDTLKLQTRNRVLQGNGYNYLGNDTGSATRIIVSGGSKNTIQIGPDTEPVGGINDFLTDVTVRNLQVTRDASSVVGSDCAGILCQFTLYTQIEYVKAAEHQIGFHYTGTVQCHTLNCYSFRSTAGSGAGTDKSYGYYIDGISNDIGAAGGNASTYFFNINASVAGSAPSGSIGCYLDGNFTDTYIENAECNNMAYGILMYGNGLSTQQYGNNDLQITSCVCDVFTIAGLAFRNISKYGSVSINGGYCAPGGGAGPIAGLYFDSCLGQVNVTNFQTICASSSTCAGIVGISSSNIECATQIIDSAVAAISLTGVTNSRFLDHITNYALSGDPAVQLAGTCSRNYFQVFATGQSSAFSIGYQAIGTTNTYNEFNCTGLDSAAISGGSANKLVINSVQITSTGLTGTNLASGVMA